MKLAYSIGEFCETYSVGKSKFHELVKSGDLKAKKLGRKTLIRHEDAEDWIKSLVEK